MTTTLKQLTNLPPILTNTDGALGTRLYFDNYGVSPVEFASHDVDTTIGFLKSRGFGDQAANVTAVVLLKQAYLDSMPVQELLDTLKGLQNLQLSSLVGQILNNNRAPSSTLGFKVSTARNEAQVRNIIP
jgi:hypothetical protein